MDRSVCVHWRKQKRKRNNSKEKNRSPTAIRDKEVRDKDSRVRVNRDRAIKVSSRASKINNKAINPGRNKDLSRIIPTVISRVSGLISPGVSRVVIRTATSRVAVISSDRITRIRVKIKNKSGLDQIPDHYGSRHGSKYSR